MMGRKICFYGEIGLILMMGHKICFNGEIWLIILVTPSYLEH